MATLSANYMALLASLLMTTDLETTALELFDGHNSQPSFTSSSADFDTVPEEGPALERAILETVGYRRLDYRLDTLNPANQVATDLIPSNTTITSGPAKVSQDDQLANLPPELLYNVLKYTDIASVFTLRHTSRYLRNTVAADHIYQKLQTHCPQIYRSLLRNKQAKHIAMGQLYEELCTENCHFCGNFGGFFNVLYLKRTCSNCIHINPKLRVDSEELLKSVHDMSASDLQALPSMLVYTIADTDPPTFAKTKVFATASLELPDLANSSARSNKQQSDDISARDAVTCPMPFCDAESETLSLGVNCAGCESEMMHAAGTYTIGQNRFAKINKVYSNKAFLEHYRTCEAAQNLFKEKYQRRARAKVAQQLPAPEQSTDSVES